MPRDYPTGTGDPPPPPGRQHHPASQRPLTTEESESSPYRIQHLHLLLRVGLRPSRPRLPPSYTGQDQGHHRASSRPHIIAVKKKSTTKMSFLSDLPLFPSPELGPPPPLLLLLLQA